MGVVLPTNTKYTLRYLLEAEPASIMGPSSSFDAHRDDHGCASKEMLSSHSICILSSHDENLMHNSG